MHYGVVMFPTEYSIAPDELARALEERGFESLWFPEHTHIPASRRSPWPGGGELPRDYWSAYDPFIALMAAAAATTRLKLGTGICLVDRARSHHHRQGGRHPRPALRRPGALRDRRRLERRGDGAPRHRVEEPLAPAPRARARHEGDLDRSARRSSTASSCASTRSGPIPSPLQKPHPPIIIGGDGATTFDRVVEFGDGWMPIMRGNVNPVERIPELRARLEKAGRDPASAPVSIFFAPPQGQRWMRSRRLASSAPSSGSRRRRGTPCSPASTPTPRPSAAEPSGRPLPPPQRRARAADRELLVRRELRRPRRAPRWTPRCCAQRTMPSRSIRNWPLSCGNWRSLLLVGLVPGVAVDPVQLPRPPP